VAYALKRLTGLPWAACFEDPWTSTKAALRPEDVSAISLGLERRLERAVVSRAEAVICLNDFHRQAMLAQFSDLHPGKFVTIPNGYDQEDFAKLEGTAPTPPMDQFVITHTGSIDYNRTPRQLFLAVRRLIDRGAVSLGQIRLQFIGNCTVAEGQPVHDMAEEYGLGEVVHLSPPIPHAEAIRAMEASHLLLVLAHDWILQVPAKTYQYLRAGRPILALAPEGATADLIKRSGAGVVVHPNDVDGIALCLERYLARFWERRPLLGADPQFVAGFDRRQLTAALSSLLRGLGSSGRTAVQIARETSPEISECPWP
jgi:glycosyltransferase involved in cell wall biosynthesis